ncbi:signal peptidase I [Quadrisphaera sp. DSM 44207]|uniref:signal peptidase I n=1 Tax=Quadrisphaera sp. DSM 44207 TaxID=1881057 RepID=UPI000882ACA8|nr:signal peptidase I [Quadrisphaera sp. DSM 44207]SDQ72180.1 signal peptidase, endoplasmic reticulum-type [Quadrisphaera sp. DSM 44207]
MSAGRVRPGLVRRGRVRRGLAAGRLLAAWVVLGLVAGSALLAGEGQPGRVRVMTVLSGSMQPALGVGDLVLTQVVRTEQLRAGDVVTFRDPTADRYVTHRVQSVLHDGAVAQVVTRGDANAVGESWSVPAGGSVGRVVAHVPRAGYVVGALATPTGRLALTGTAGALGLAAVVMIWLPRRPDEAVERAGEDAGSSARPVVRTPRPWARHARGVLGGR